MIGMTNSMKFVTKSDTEYDIVQYDESYNPDAVTRVVTFASSVDISAAIQALTADELSQAKIKHVAVTIDLPPVEVESGYRTVMPDSVPMSTVYLKEVE